MYHGVSPPNIRFVGLQCATIWPLPKAEIPLPPKLISDFLQVPCIDKSFCKSNQFIKLSRFKKQSIQAITTSNQWL